MARRSANIPDPRLVDARNRVALSKEAMRALDVVPGEYVTFEVDEHGGVRLLKLSIGIASPRRPPSSRSSA
ncbi:MAG TPA: hypothetical protein VM286_04255 [Candidatus Thermoplasmatota archaeon]|nr:hypothetical protein [Candidatus Thermoplasmatota archaeon]